MATIATPGDVLKLMPGTSPPPRLRRPARAAHVRYLSDDLERAYATLADQLDALEQDIHRARRTSRHARSPRREPPPAPSGEPVFLADGVWILIRPIEAGDAQELRWGFERLSAGSRYQRFLAPIAYLTQAQLDFLTRVDHSTHEALVAVDATTGEGVGVARFIRDGRDPTRADVALVVADRWQGRGVGTLLAERLAARARTVGVTSFTARMLAGNHTARRLVEHVAENVQERDVDGAVVLTARAREHAASVAAPPHHVATRPRASLHSALELARHPGGGSHTRRRSRRSHGSLRIDPGSCPRR